MLLLIQYTLIFASVLLLVALGGCISEHSGIINLGLEGIMVVGALGGALCMSTLSTTTPVVMVVCAMIAAILAGMLYSCLLGVAAIHFNADQTLVGTAMNLLATAAATVLVKAMNTAANPDNHSSEIEYVSEDPPEQDQAQRGPAQRRMPARAVVPGSLVPQELGGKQEQQDGNEEDQAGVIAESGPDAQVQQLMQGTLRAAAGAFEPGRPKEGTLGERCRLGVELCIDADGKEGGERDQDHPDRLPLRCYHSAAMTPSVTRTPYTT